MLPTDIFSELQGIASSVSAIPGQVQQALRPAQVSQPANVSSEIAQTESDLGVQPWGGVGQQFEQDVLNMEASGRSNVGRIQLPPGVGPQDFMTLLSYGEAFAASAGWRYAPTAQMYNQMMQQGLFRSDQSSVFQWLAQVNGVSGKMPWAAAGLTHTQYQNQMETIADTIGEYTGNRSEFSDLQQQAITNRWSAQHLIQEMQNNPKYWSSAPWLKFGETYQGWKNYKRQNQALAQQRFGEGAVSDRNYATMYEEAAQSRPQSGGSFTLQQRGSGGLVSSTGQSAVR